MPELIESFTDGVATLTMNRPEARNAMSDSMMSALQTALPRLATDPAVRAVVLTGAGGAFCAGGDVKGMASNNKSRSNQGTNEASPPIEHRIQGLRNGMEASRLLFEMPKPTLAVIPGPAAGAGLSLALACDMRVALDTAKLTTAFAKIGASGDYGSSYFLTQLVGAAKARELFFLSDIISGQQAYELGLVNQVFSADKLEAGATTLAQRLAKMPTLALGYMKQNLNAAIAGASISQVFDLEAAHMVRTMSTEDHKAAAKAFVEKTTPEFKGR